MPYVGFAFSKEPLLCCLVILGFQLAFALPARPAESVVVEIVQFLHQKRGSKQLAYCLVPLPATNLFLCTPRSGTCRQWCEFDSYRNCLAVTENLQLYRLAELLLVQQPI